MSEENSTDSLDSGVEEQVDSSSETIDEGDGGSSEAKEETSASGSSKKSENWFDTDGLDEKSAKRIKQIESHWTRVNQEKARLQREAEQAAQTKQQMAQYQELMRQALENPDYYEQTRKQYLTAKGLDPNVVGKKEIKPEEINTKEDLQRYLSQEREKMRSDFQSELQKVAAPLSKDRWVQANNSLQAKYGDVYQKYHNEVLTQVANGPYASLYQSGMSEQDVLEAAFKSLAMDDLLAREREKVLVTAQQKKMSATERPRKSANPNPSRPLTREEIIEELRASGLSFER